MINRWNSKFKEVADFFEEELKKNKEFEGFLQIRWNGNFFYSTISFSEIVDHVGLEDVVLQVKPAGLINAVECSQCCVHFGCSGGVDEEKIEHIVFDFFEEPELFVREEFVEGHSDFFE